MDHMDEINAELMAKFGCETSCPDSPIKSFDGREWAHSFVQAVKRNPEIATDIDCMHTWFASALMRGWDEKTWRSKEYKAQIRRVLVPWWRRFLAPLHRFER